MEALTPKIPRSATKSEIPLTCAIKIIITEDEQSIIATMLMQKYYYGYELSAWTSKKNQQSIENFIKFMSNFQLLGNYEITNYDDLNISSSEYINLHTWPDTNATNNQDVFQCLQCLHQHHQRTPMFSPMPPTNPTPPTYTSVHAQRLQ